MKVDLSKIEKVLLKDLNGNKILAKPLYFEKDSNGLLTIEIQHIN